MLGVERGRKRHEARVLDAVREAPVVQHVAKGSCDRLARRLERPSSVDDFEPVAVSEIDRSDLARQGLGRDERGRPHRLCDLRDVDAGDCTHGLELLELVGEPLRGRHRLDGVGGQHPGCLERIVGCGGELVALAAEDDDDVVRHGHERSRPRVVRAEDELLAAVGKTHRLAACKRAGERRLISSIHLDQPGPAGSSAAAAEVDELAVGHPAQHEQVGGADRRGRGVGTGGRCHPLTIGGIRRGLKSCSRTGSRSTGRRRDGRGRGR